MQDIENNITTDNLKILMLSAINQLKDNEIHIKKLTELKLKKNEKHLKSISVLDKKITKYLNASKREQSNLVNFKKIAGRIGLNVEELTKEQPLVQKQEVVSMVNKNTGESVNLTQEEIEYLEKLTGE